MWCGLREVSDQCISYPSLIKPSRGSRKRQPGCWVFPVFKSATHTRSEYISACNPTFRAPQPTKTWSIDGASTTRKLRPRSESFPTRWSVLSRLHITTHTCLNSTSIKASQIRRSWREVSRPCKILEKEDSSNVRVPQKTAGQRARFHSPSHKDSLRLGFCSLFERFKLLAFLFFIAHLFF